MMYLVDKHWLWLVLAFVIGGVVGWMTCNSEKPRWLGGWVLPGFVVTAAVAALVALKLVPGRAGYWLELALLFFVTYIIGCFVGGIMRSLFGEMPEPVTIRATPEGLGRGASIAVPAQPVGFDQAARPAHMPSPGAAPAPSPGQFPPRSGSGLPGVPPPRPITHRMPDGRPGQPRPQVPIPRLTPRPTPVAPPPRPIAVRTVGTTPAYPGRRPQSLASPLGIGQDDLKLVQGIGPKIERTLNSHGIFHFCQIADWSAGEAEWVGHALAFPGRIEREHWIEQAGILCAGRTTEYSRAVRGGKVVPTDAPLTAADGARLKTTLMEASHSGRKPPVLSAPMDGERDDLTLIKGIGPKNQRILNDLGIFHFGQIAYWSPEEAEWIGHAMAFPGRVGREFWIEQAGILCAGGETDHSRAVRSGAVTPSDAVLSGAEAARLRDVLVITRLPGQRPEALTAPLDGKADDLKRIKGIGPKNEDVLNGLGIWHFRQIAAWSPAEAEWIGHAMAFPGRIEREGWIQQAQTLLGGAANVADIAQAELPLAGLSPDAAAPAVESGEQPEIIDPLARMPVRSQPPVSAEDAWESHGEQPEIVDPLTRMPVRSQPPVSAEDAWESDGEQPEIVDPLTRMPVHLAQAPQDGAEGHASEKPQAVEPVSATDTETPVESPDLAVTGGSEAATDNVSTIAESVAGVSETAVEEQVAEPSAPADPLPLLEAEAPLPASDVETVIDPVAPEPAVSDEPEPMPVEALVASLVEIPVEHVVSEHVVPSPEPVEAPAEEAEPVSAPPLIESVVSGDTGPAPVATPAADTTSVSDDAPASEDVVPSPEPIDVPAEEADPMAAPLSTEPAAPDDAGPTLTDTPVAEAEPASAEPSASEDTLPVAEHSAVSAPVAPASPVENEESFEGLRPAGYATPVGAADNLKRIKGIGRQNEARLHELGIWHFDQIATWSEENIRWVSAYLAFPGRIEREQWVSQAAVLAAGGNTDFSRRVGEAQTPPDEPGGAGAA